MKKILLIVVLLVGVFLLFGGKFKWLITDMGWCKSYGYGLKIHNFVIFNIPQGQTGCV
jgi:hypothetical protein